MRKVPDKRLRPFYEKMRAKEPIWRTLIMNRGYSEGGWGEPAPAIFEHMYNDLLFKRESLTPVTTRGRSGYELLLPSNEYEDCLAERLFGATFFTTRGGFIGVGVPGIRKGDQVTIWFGAKPTFIVRPSQEAEDPCSLVGAAYVGGIIEGEIVNDLYLKGLMDFTTLWLR